MVQKPVGALEPTHQILVKRIRLGVDEVALQALEAGKQILSFSDVGADKRLKFLKGVAARDKPVGAVTVDMEAMGGEQAALENLPRVWH